MNDIEVLLRGIEQGYLLNPSSLSDFDAEAALSARDDPTFEEDWTHLFNTIKDVDLDPERMTLVEKLREAAFKAVYNATGHDDLSAYVSDDFEVIGRGVASGLSSRFLSGLLKAYIDGKVPSGIGVGSERSTGALIDQVREKL